MGIFAPATIIGRPISTVQIARSLRLRSSSLAYLSRAFAANAPELRKTTISFWVKRGVLGTGPHCVLASRIGAGASYSLLFFSNDTLTYQDNSGSIVATSAVFRDPSAWYHVVVAFDTTQATASDRMWVYVNGVRLTSFSSTTYPALNANTWFLTTQDHYIGQQASGQYFDGYFADFNVISGQTLTPASFGEFNATTGVWSPIRYTGAYGTNGFRLDFADNSAATAAAIGADRSGNGNNFTPTNISVTAGLTNDSLVDSPTNYGTDSGVGGEVRGNYCTLDPLDNGGNVLSTGNLTLTRGGAAAWKLTRATMFNDSIPEYWEYTATAVPNEDENVVGWASSAAAINAVFGVGAWVIRFNASTTAITVLPNGGTVTLVSTGDLAVNDVLMFARDPVSGKAWIGRNGVWLDAGAGAGNPAAGTNPIMTGLTGAISPAAWGHATAGAGVFNFGQRPYAYAAPSGFKALCTQNLPDPAIIRPNKYFDINLRTGTGAAANITGKAFQPDFLWIKNRGAGSHHLVDSTRGVANVMFTDSTAAEGSRPLCVTALNADGYSLGTGSDGNVNASANTYVDWFWKEGVLPGLDIVAFNGPASAGTVAINHNLGVVPAMYIVKNRGGVGGWWMNHKGLANQTDKFLGLAGTNAVGTLSWGGAPTSTQVFATDGYVQTGSIASIAYIFAEVPGFSKFGNYTGNGAADGPFVHCGFRPRFVLIKRVDSTSDWTIWDTARDQVNASLARLFPNLSLAEAGAAPMDILSNGFKHRDAGAAINASGGTYIYTAFAESPFKFVRAR